MTRPSCCAGDLKLSLPSRLGVGTVKAAAWQVGTSGFGVCRCRLLGMLRPKNQQPELLCSSAFNACVPSRLPGCTCTAACLPQVLAESGPEGMHLEDICR